MSDSVLRVESICKNWLRLATDLWERSQRRDSSGENFRVKPKVMLTPRFEKVPTFPDAVLEAPAKVFAQCEVYFGR